MRCMMFLIRSHRKSEAVVQRCSVKKLPETCNFIKKETLAQVFSCEFCEISKNTFVYRTPLVAASVKCIFEYIVPKPQTEKMAVALIFFFVLRQYLNNICFCFCCL